MPKQKLKETIYTSGSPAKSKILQTSFINRINSLYGFRTVVKNSDADNSTLSHLERSTGIKFVKVDLDNDSFRITQASLGQHYENKPMSDKLERYYDAYLHDTTTSYSDIQDRQRRISELTFMRDNSPFIQKDCDLVADEATQLDMQNRIISIESPDSMFVQRTYELLAEWGVTQRRIRNTSLNIELYGEAFWLQDISKDGVLRIRPIHPQVVMERLEFAPIKMAQYLAERDGYMTADKNRAYKIEKLIELLNDESTTSDASDVTSAFDNKLLGYELEGGIMEPPWAVTHFRIDEEIGEFYPYGRPPLLHCLTPFKQLMSTCNLQGMARGASFPVNLFEVTTAEGMSPALAFQTVNDTREEYDNIGVSPSTQGNETYTLNTTVWAPKGLLEYKSIKSDVDFDFIEDLKTYDEMLQQATTVPKGYFTEFNANGGTSALSLMEQWKPFGRHVFSNQSVILQGLGELIRLHYAITGEFDYNTPFVLSMRFPADESSNDKQEARLKTLDVVDGVVKTLRSALGIGEDEPLPKDVMTDILNKYSFLDPTDLKRWLTLSDFEAKAGGSGDDSGSGSDSGNDSFDTGGDSGGGGLDLGGGDSGSDDTGSDTGVEDTGTDTDTGSSDTGETMNASTKHDILAKRGKRIQEQKLQEKRIRERRLRERQIRERYSAIKESTYFKILENQHMRDFNNHYGDGHIYLVDKITVNDPMYESFNILHNNKAEVPEVRKSLREMIDEKREEAAEKKDFEMKPMKEALEKEGLYYNTEELR